MAEMQSLVQKSATVRDLVQKQMRELVKAVPKGIDPMRFARVALTTFSNTPKLLDCTPRSLIACMMQAAAWGLELDPVLGLAYLVPYGDKCQLIIGYQGFIELGRRSGEISSVMARVVHDGDEYELEYGLNEKLIHKPLPMYGGDKTAGPVAFYAVVTFKDGHKLFDWMWKTEVDAIRARSRAKDSGPWVTDYERMGCKTVIRRLYKVCPKSPELASAIGLDEKTDLGIDQKLEAVTAFVDDVPAQGSKLDKLTAALPAAQPTPEAEPILVAGTVAPSNPEQPEPQTTSGAAPGPGPKRTQPSSRKELTANDIFHVKREPGEDG